MFNPKPIFAIALALLVGACSGTSTTDEYPPVASSTSLTATEATELPSSRTVSQILSDDQPTRVLTIKHHQSECEGFYVGHCYLVRQGDGPWELLYEQIEGLDYQWGVNTQVLLEPKLVADTESLTDLIPGYQLLSVLQSSEHHGGSGFDYVARGGHEAIASLGGQLYTLHGDKTFRCTPQDCATIDSLLDQQQTVLLRFSHALSTGEPLTLEAVMCADAPDAFYQSCAMPDLQAL